MTFLAVFHTHTHTLYMYTHTLHAHTSRTHTHTTHTHPVHAHTTCTHHVRIHTHTLHVHSTYTHTLCNHAHHVYTHTTCTHHVCTHIPYTHTLHTQTAVNISALVYWYYVNISSYQRYHWLLFCFFFSQEGLGSIDTGGWAFWERNEIHSRWGNESRLFVQHWLCIAHVKSHIRHIHICTDSRRIVYEQIEAG